MRRALTALPISLSLVLLVAPVQVMAAAPTVTGFNPTSGPIGTSVTVTGTGFIGTTSVRFNGVSAAFSNVTPTSLKATVPAGASTGKISVTKPGTTGGTGTSAANFKVTLGITISRAVAPPTTVINVSGTAFTVNGWVDLYFDTTHLALVAADAKGNFTNAKLTVPASALPGGHWISAVNRFNSTVAQKPFTVRTDWPQFHAGPLRRGRNTTENVISAANVGGLDVAWTYTAGGSIVSSPAVANGVVYVGSGDGNLYALAVGCASGGGTCSPLWKGSTGGYIIHSSPAVANGVVYVGSTGGKLYAFAVGCRSDGGTCTPLWTGATVGGIDYSSPAVANGVVYVGSLDNKLYAYPVGCRSDGGACPSPLWTGATGSAIASSPAVANGVVYVGSYDAKLYAYPVGCRSDGGACTSLLWTGAPLGAITSSPAVANGVVYVGADKLYAYPVGCRSDGGECPALWTGATGFVTLSSPAVANGVVYVGSTDTNLHAYPVGCRSDGGACPSPLWTGATTGQIFSSPAVANGVVYVGSDDARIYAFAVGCNTGGGPCSPLWTGATRSAIGSSPAVADGVVYVGSTDGKLYAYSLDTGPDPASAAVVRRPDLARLRPDPAIRR